MKESYFLLEMRELSGVTQFALIPPDKSGSCSGPLQNTHKQWKWPLTPRMRPQAPQQLIGWMDNNPPSKGMYCFGGEGGGVWSSKCSFVPLMMHHRNIGVF